MEKNERSPSRVGTSEYAVPQRLDNPPAKRAPEDPAAIFLEVDFRKFFRLTVMVIRI